MNEWDGRERRLSDSKILVLMTEIANDMKHMVKNFDKHVADDEVTSKKVTAIESKMAWYAGGLAVLLFVFGLLPKFVK